MTVEFGSTKVLWPRGKGDAKFQQEQKGETGRGKSAVALKEPLRQQKGERRGWGGCNDIQGILNCPWTSGEEQPHPSWTPVKLRQRWVLK